MQSGANRPAKGPRTKTPKTRKALVARAPIDDAEKELVERLRRERNEAVELQVASAEVLKIISSSPSNLKFVFEAMLASALRICEAKFGHVLLYDGERFHAAHLHDVPPAYRKFWEQNGPITPSPNTGLGRLARTRQVAHIPDLKADSAYAEREPLRVVTVEQAGARTFLSVPMLKANELIGAIVIYRQEVRPFAEKQIDLVKSFADQAVIAIENARLFNEVQAKTRDLEESLQQQTATAEVLKVISRSAFDLQPVFSTIVQTASRLCEAEFALIYELRGDRYEIVAANNAAEAFVKHAADNPLRLGRGSLVGRTGLERKPVHIPDCLADPEYSALDYQAVGHYRTMLGVPLLREGVAIGVIGMQRTDVRPFTDKQIELVQTFADQAVIAIENVRLFNETQEALERQTATADILKVIASSPDNVQPVFQAIADRSKRLVDALSTTVFRLADGMLHLRAFTPTTPQADARLQASFPAPLSTFSWGEAISKGEIYRVIDAEQEPERLRELARERGWRSALLVPLLRDGKPIGMIGPTRAEPGPFTEHHVQLMQTFADQAVIAIRNVELFDEVQARTRDLSESLEQQTATSEVLQVISSSSGELDPVFNKMLENATRICGARFGTMTLYEDGGFRTVALYNAPKAYADTQLYKVIRPHPESGLSAVQRTREPVYIADIRNESPYVEGNANVRALADLGGARTIIIVPMLRDNELIGTITIYRQEVKPFTDKQTELVSHFANQAVIAIENARLLNELRERTEELSRSLEDLRAAQDRLVQTEKLASLGQLTAGIAHEIKNPLNFVNNFSALSAELVDEMTDVFENPALDEANRRKELDEIRDLLKSNLEKVVQHGKRADSIVKNMLLHSREGSGEQRAADINATSR